MFKAQVTRLVHMAQVFLYGNWAFRVIINGIRRPTTKQRLDDSSGPIQKSTVYLFARQRLVQLSRPRADAREILVHDVVAKSIAKHPRSYRWLSPLHLAFRPPARAPTREPLCKLPQDVFRVRRELAEGESRVEGEFVVQGKTFENWAINVFARQFEQ